VGTRLEQQQATMAQTFHSLKQRIFMQRVLAAWLKHGRQRRKLEWAAAHWRRRQLVRAFFEWQFAATKQR
jgi:hypothetical protein